MKKNKLLKLIAAIPGNPEILLWNGMVGDWMQIDRTPVECRQVRLSFDTWRSSVEFQHKRPLTQEELTTMRKEYGRTHQWSDNEFVEQDAIDKGHYKKRTVVILQAKSRGLSTFDRLGSIGY